MSAGKRRVAVSGGEISSVGAEAKFGNLRGAVAGPDLDDAGHGVGAVERALGAADKLHAIGLIQRESAEVEGASGFVDGDAVDDDFVVARFTAADEERGQASALAGSVDDRAGKKTDGVAGGGGSRGCQLRSAERVDVGAGGFAGDWGAGRADDYRFRRGRETKLDGEFRLGGNVESLGREAGSENLDLILPGIGSVEGCDAFGRGNRGGEYFAVVPTQEPDLSAGDGGRLRIDDFDCEIDGRSSSRKNETEKEANKDAHSILLCTRKRLP